MPRIPDFLSPLPTVNSASPKTQDWRKQLQHASRVLIASDFDGTLAEIVPDPDAATPLPEAIAVLSRLAQLPRARVAIVSGRALADLCRRCPVPGSWSIGGHGIELGAPTAAAGSGDLVPVDGPALALRQHLLGATAAIERQLPRWPGTELETKPYAVAVHFRRAPEWADAVLDFLTGLAGPGSGFRLMAGRQVVELLPRDALTKGLALQRLRTQLDCDLAFYFGDDVTDEDVFRLEDPAMVGVKVVSPETAQRATAARYSLSSPAAVVQALATIERLIPAAAKKKIGFSSIQP